MRATSVLLASLAGCGGTGLRSPDALPQPGTSISIYCARDDRVPAQLATGPVTTAMAATYGYGYRTETAPTPAAAIPPIALIVDRRWVELSRGSREIALVPVASTLDPSSTWVRSLSDPEGTDLVAQRYEGVRSSGDALLGMNVGREIEVTTTAGALSGRLLGYDASEITLAFGDGTVRAIPRDADVLSIGLGAERSLGEPVLRPTLRTETEGRHLIEVAYEARGLTWWVDYGVEVSRADGGPATIGLVSRATVDNASGMPISDARLSLYSGTLGTAGKEALLVWSGRATIGRDEQKQFRIRREARAIRGAVEYVYRGGVPDAGTDDKDAMWGSQGQSQVRRQVTFTNSTALGIGGVLPMGRALVSLSRGKGAEPERLESFLLDRVDVGEQARFDLGPVRFLEGERRQAQVERSQDGNRVVETYELKVRNLSDRAVKVRIVERLARSGSVTVSGIEPTAKRVKDELHFVVDIEPHQATSARYQATYRW